MPQMGESIFEGTITKWLKKAGDTVEKDEPLFEISTDKVDAEIPSPVAGVLTEIKAGEGETVQINTVVAVIGGSGAAEAQPTGHLMEPTETLSPPTAAGAPQAPLAPPQVVDPDRRIRPRRWYEKLRRSTTSICGWCPARVRTGGLTRKIFCAT